MFNRSGYRFAGESVKGLVRKRNEDSFLISAPAGRRAALAVVADGVGGNRHGDIASYIICREAGAAFARISDEELLKEGGAEKFFADTFAAINRRIFAINLKDFSTHPMGSTLLAVLFTPGRAVMLNVGDSRLYMASGEKTMVQLSCDHILANEKGFPPALFEKNPRMAHALSRAIGTKYNLKVEMKTFALEGNERFLLCSDGVYRELEEKKVESLLKGSSSPEQALNGIMRSVFLEGARDNTSAVTAFPC